MATRRVVVAYDVDRTVHTRDWGLAPGATPSHEDIRTILGAVHNVDPGRVLLIAVHQYWKVETTPTHPALSKESGT